MLSPSKERVNRGLFLVYEVRRTVVSGVVMTHVVVTEILEGKRLSHLFLKSQRTTRRYADGKFRKKNWKVKVTRRECSRCSRKSKVPKNICELEHPLPSWKKKLTIVRWESSEKTWHVNQRWKHSREVSNEMEVITKEDRELFTESPASQSYIFF